ncbi:MAG: HAD-IA family hydrolase [Kiritimatiellae bacterium]|nr:HAD-IA family hydrolase [Kiritimatiellia bacterium]
MKRHAAYIFDMDGVLCETIPAHIEAWKRYSRSRGRELTEEEIIAWMGADNRYYLERILGRAATPGEVAECVSSKEGLYRAIMAQNLREPKGLRRFLSRARADGIRLAVATGAPPENVEFIMRGLAIGDFFESITDSGKVAHCKPAPDCYLAAAAALGLAASSCMVFEDAAGGIKAAQAAGMDVVAVEGTLSRSELALLHPQRIIKSFEEML